MPKADAQLQGLLTQCANRPLHLLGDPFQLVFFAFECFRNSKCIAFVYSAPCDLSFFVAFAMCSSNLRGKSSLPSAVCSMSALPLVADERTFWEVGFVPIVRRPFTHRT
jgi:hypothetical protein